ncbi:MULTISPECIES: AGE family epimerase/isomerase [unclassified Sphingobacterium]|uniref:AGE family epimerase/isomerase n=1 Tax=unclassified Sphingobacterium TaxID=2609468 RepID=UPI001AE4371C|nr:MULTISPECIES: AGE family epimerase/isomerase [unclassified Sphingobacterium]MDR6734377.1 N-acylglucosamine 2-epimerase [Sphingobacterium sp. 2149]
MNHYSTIYKDELFNHILPFWTAHSLDRDYGGYFTCLDRRGEVFDTDKFMWLQGRQVWLFSSIYNKIESRSSWLDIAMHGADFMEKYGRDDEGNWYFSLDRQGKALVKPYNIFSDCFAAMGFGALYTATQEQRYAEIAQHTFHNILKRRNHTKGIYDKTVPGTRPSKNFALPMILSNLSIELEHLLDPTLVQELIEDVVVEVMDVFYKEDQGLVFENVSPNGALLDSFEGRLLNPGHAIEAMWFMMDLGERLQRPALIEKAMRVGVRMLEYGWDEKYGGIFYFMDAQGKPTQQLEWDQKLWWVHCETLVCMAKAWVLTGNEEAKRWFERVHEYTWTHFRDPEHGEWFGYLNRRGEVLLDLKGGKWKGCFHVPRALWKVYEVFEKAKIIV